MKFRYVSFMVVIAATLMGGCANPSKTAVATEIYQPTLASSPTVIPLSTDTPQPSIHPAATRLAFTPESTTVAGWYYSIPEIISPELINISTAKLFNGLRIPPLPDGFTIEFYSIPPYGGELSYEPILYTLYLVRKGNSRMLWLGIPFKATERCCGQDTPTRIYDSIPFPPFEIDNLLIPFVCWRNNQNDFSLIVIAETPPKGQSATNIRYAWRIDQETTSLKSVSVQGIECSPNW